MSYHFRPAQSFTERHGLFVALVAPTNAGKTFSGLRLARGIAGPKGKVAVLDTEGGRTLHLKEHFDFDVMVMEPPHRPERYSAAARAAQDAGYDALLIDSFSMEWRGVGGVLDWIDESVDAAVERQRAIYLQKGWSFDENKSRGSNKAAGTIRPKMAHKLMVAGFLGLRIPIIFSIRGEMTFDPDTNKEKFKPQCQAGFLFEVTVSFRLAADRKGVVDLSDPAGWKMEASHREIFRDGDQLSEEHGAKLAAWARGELGSPPATSRQPVDPMEFWTRETLAIPVKMKADESGTDWPAWQARMVKAALSAPDQSALLRLTSDNGSPMSGLEKAEPDLYAELRQAVADRTERLNAAVGDLLGSDA